MSTFMTDEQAAHRATQLLESTAGASDIDTMMRQARARAVQSQTRMRRLEKVQRGLEILLEVAEAQTEIEFDLREVPGEAPSPSN